MRKHAWRWMPCVLWAAMAVSAAEETQVVGPFLQSISVNVCCPQGMSSQVQGSGTIVLVQVGGKPAAFVLTAYHVIERQREVKTVIAEGGEERKQVVYRDAQVIQEQVENGRVVGELKYDARIVNGDPRRDIGLLWVRKGDFAEHGARFYLDEMIPQPGTRVYHCGAPGGKEIGGTCSLTTGIVSRLGVRIPQFGGSEHGVFDQTDCAALGGSSGGLLALESDGRFIGLITLGLRGGDSFHWVVPVRSVREWAKDIKAEWLIDPKAARPSEEDVKKVPLELNPPGFAAASTEPSATIAEEDMPETIVRRLPASQ